MTEGLGLHQRKHGKAAGRQNQEVRFAVGAAGEAVLQGQQKRAQQKSAGSAEHTLAKAEHKTFCGQPLRSLHRDRADEQAACRRKRLRQNAVFLLEIMLCGDAQQGDEHHGGYVFERSEHIAQQQCAECRTERCAEGRPDFAVRRHRSGNGSRERTQGAEQAGVAQQKAGTCAQRITQNGLQGCIAAQLQGGLVQTKQRFFQIFHGFVTSLFFSSILQQATTHFLSFPLALFVGMRSKECEKYVLQLLYYCVIM